MRVSAPAIERLRAAGAPDPRTIDVAGAAGLARLGALELVSLLQSHLASSHEVTTAFLERIGARDGPVGAWARVYPERALALAEAADARLSPRRVRLDGPAPLLCGIPLGLKDVIAVDGLPLTLGSPAFDDHVARADADAWERLRGRGMVLLGHTSTQEFASGRSPQNVRNPWDLRHSPGGSSNGSAAAVADRTTPVALGTDVGGSLRRPASACGVTTVIGTAGRVSTRGIVSFDRSRDRVGPIARSAAECALLLHALARRDTSDANTPAVPPPRLSRLTPSAGDRPLAGRRIGVPALDAFAPVARAVGDLFLRFQDELSGLGATLLALTAPPLPAADVRPPPGLVAFHRRNFAERGHRYTAFGRSDVGAMLMQAGAPPTEYQLHAGAVARGRFVSAWRALFRDLRLDAVALPAQTQVTPRLPPEGEGGDLARFGNVDIRLMWNLLGMPVVCLPAGVDADAGLPLGVQLAGPPWAERSVLQLAIDFQSRTGHHRRVPEDAHA